MFIHKNVILLICQVKHAKKPGLCFPNSLVLPFGNTLEIEKFRDLPLRKTFLLRFTSLQTSHVVFLHTLSPAPELVKHCKKLEIEISIIYVTFATEKFKKAQAHDRYFKNPILFSITPA